MRHLLLVLTVAALSACGPAGPECSASTCTGCCDAAGACQPGDTPTACGAASMLCMSCAVGESCAQGRCAPVAADCVPESDGELCRAAAASCGTWVGRDRCQQPRTVACGSCPTHTTCGGGGTPGVCGCTPSTDAAICSSFGHDCGPLTATDNCGHTRTVNCGGCNAPYTCNTGPGWCECVSENSAELCARHQASCGTLTGTDNCGAARTVQCGACSTGSTCGAGGVANACYCPPESTAAFCARLGKNCGATNGLDSCGLSRTNVACGTCTGTASCGGSGVANLCGTCAADGQSCSTAAQCCTGRCSSGLCGAPVCKADGVACTAASQCCTGQCSSGSCGAPACRTDGLSCTSASQCCTGTCTLGYCGYVATSCNPVSNVGCNPGEGCLVLSSSETPTCAVLGSGTQGAYCSASTPCAGGYGCFAGTCRKICLKSTGAGCASGSVCNGVSGWVTWGACT